MVERGEGSPLCTLLRSGPGRPLSASVAPRLIWGPPSCSPPPRSAPQPSLPMAVVGTRCEDTAPGFPSQEPSQRERSQLNTRQSGRAASARGPLPAPSHSPHRRARSDPETREETREDAGPLTAEEEPCGQGAGRRSERSPRPVGASRLDGRGASAAQEGTQV